jgi:hypothetical protein
MHRSLAEVVLQVVIEIHGPQMMKKPPNPIIPDTFSRVIVMRCQRCWVQNMHESLPSAISSMHINFQTEEPTQNHAAGT